MAYRETLSRFFRAVLAASLASFAMGAELEWKQLLQRVTARVVANQKSVRNHTCVETVRRDFFRPAANTLPRACPVLLEQRRHPTLDMQPRLISTDRLRLEVATSGRGEVTSRVGASKFEDGDDIDRVVSDGPIGTGAFGAFLGVIFQADVREFGFAGETMRNGRRALRYRFAVPNQDSHYRVKVLDGNGWVTASYSGDLLVDLETADPVQLTIQTDEVPTAAGVCQTESTLNFSRVAIGGNDLMLPDRAVQRFIYPDGKEIENTIGFSNCREYSSESKLTFAPEPAGPTGGSSRIVEAAPLRIPEGLRLKFELVTPIDSDAAAAGDRFTARLTEALRDGRQVVAPKGTVVVGRISMVETFYRPSAVVFLGLAPEALEIRGAKVPMDAVLDARTRKVKGEEIFLPPAGQHAGVFRFNGTRAVLRRGAASEWITKAHGN